MNDLTLNFLALIRRIGGKQSGQLAAYALALATGNPESESIGAGLDAGLKRVIRDGVAELRAFDEVKHE